MKVRWSARAVGDLRRIADCIVADDKPIAARAFAAAIAAKAELLSSRPLLGRATGFDDVRELIVHRNHLLSYRVRGDEVQLLQIWHAAQRR